MVDTIVGGLFSPRISSTQ